LEWFIAWTPKPAAVTSSHIPDDDFAMPSPPKPTTDRDNGVIPDKDDKCPDEEKDTLGECMPRETATIVGSQIVVLKSIEFEFDKAIIKPEGKTAIDAFARDLRGVSFDVINVTGHTDRIGTDAYNMKLSTRRAEAVRTYLIESAQIPAAKIAASGKDGADPVTKPGECKGKSKTPKLIACLQPDRRVDIEVTGTK